MEARRAHLPPERFDVRISEPGEIAAALPVLLGFRPQESVVLVSLTGPSGGRVGLTVRGDLPPPDGAAAAAAALVRSVGTDDPCGVLVAVVSEAPDVPSAGRAANGDGGPPGLPHRALVRELVVALAADGVPVREALLVRDGRWWSYDCPHPCCAPGAGTALPEGVTPLEAASVATGTVVERDRGDLVRRISGPPGTPGPVMAAVCALVGAECAARIGDVGADVVAEESWSAVTAAVARCRPAGRATGLTDEEVARVAWGLRDRDVRDRALELAVGDDAPAAEILWTECTRRTPAPLDAAPATMLAVSAWLRGDGAMANVALARALASDPAYALARLLAQALAQCVPPSDLRTIIAGTLPRDRRVGR
jgi:hypothetical protein